MKLKYTGNSSAIDVGYGQRRGALNQTEYECPCGKGTVTFEKDDIPGFKTINTLVDCPECEEKYDFHKGTAIEK
ncbi:hypothetical protein ACFVP8_08435 [Viridibacillus arvi]|uniref:hypothetical protein n=1 Tax=Viridibacillus arvi TaxID=263475 RepID=UPI00367ECC24